MSDLLLQDDIVQAALEYIDHFDEVPLSVPPHPVTKRSRMNSSQRVRMEIQQLRVLVRELEVRLRELQDQSSSNNAVDETQVVWSKLWESIATTQNQERRRVEHENVRLRQMLMKQARIMRQAEKLLTRGQRLHYNASIDDGIEIGPSSVKDEYESDTCDSRSSCYAPVKVEVSSWS